MEKSSKANTQRERERERKRRTEREREKDREEYEVNFSVGELPLTSRNLFFTDKMMETDPHPQYLKTKYQPTFFFTLSSLSLSVNHKVLLQTCNQFRILRFKTFWHNGILLTEMRGKRFMSITKYWWSKGREKYGDRDLETKELGRERLEERERERLEAREEEREKKMKVFFIIKMIII